MRRVTTNQLKRSIAEYYDAGKLQFQSPNPQCILIDDNDIRCAIGACLNANDIDQLHSLKYDVRYLKKNGIVQFEDEKFARLVQMHHDQIVRAIRMEEDKVADYISKFKKLVSIE
jgi:hypothetical protein